VVFLKYYTHIPSQASQVYILSDGFKKVERVVGGMPKQANQNEEGKAWRRCIGDGVHRGEPYA
jgi:hypothetical protein